MNAQEIESGSLNIKRHDGVRTREKQQVQEALELVNAQSESASSKQMKRRHSYQRFLKKIQEATSVRMVVLCAVGLGKSRVASMRDGVRLSLPLQIKDHEAALDCEVLQSIVDGISVGKSPESALPTPFSAEGTDVVVNPEEQRNETTTGALDGRVYGLTVYDVRSLVMSNEALGGVWLTDPYDVNHLPFVTIQISKELGLRYATQRPQSM